MLADAGAALLLFAGGDGTARDIVAGIGRRVPSSASPAGSRCVRACSRASPEAAGDMAAEFLASTRPTGAAADVVDLVEGGASSGRARTGCPRSSCRGQASVPAGAGPPARAEELVALSARSAMLDALCAAVAGDLVPGTLYLFGPGLDDRGGSWRSLGLHGTPLGVDAVRDGALIGADLGERDPRADGPVARRPGWSSGSSAARASCSAAATSSSAPPCCARLRPEDLIDHRGRRQAGRR